jgi:hypothetical protein
LLKSIALNCLLLFGFASPALCQTLSAEEIKTRIDAVIANAFQSASAQFPCKVKSGGKPKMLKWQDVGKCLNYANDRVDWQDVSHQLQAIRVNSQVQATDIMAMAESALRAHALTYDRIFVVKETETLLPLSSSLLKFLPEGSLQDLPVLDKSGKEVGKFSGTYSFEKMGDISGNRNRMVLFQYTDPKGNAHGSPEKLLLDSYGVPWKGAISQPGFRLPPDRINVR